MQSVPGGKIKEGADYPATFVSYDDAMKFCEKMTADERRAGRLPSDWKYALPTEIRWEYACRAATATDYSFGENASELGEYAWFDKNADEADEKFAHLVRQKKPNAWNLYDMYGNVSEWCRDYSEGLERNGDDPRPAVVTSERVVRGGSWNGPASTCRSAYRSLRASSVRDIDIGFRVARLPSNK
jgi:formylglycine-generating enzyme required for sulfatase activity